jgi:uncharacterized protein
MRRVLVDTGPLVAILSAEDQYHEICVNALHDLPGPLFCCWPVLTEVAWLLRRHPSVIQQLLGNVSKRFLGLLALTSADANAIGALMEKYEDIRPQLADACLVHLAERERIDTIFTLDQRDFSVYRRGSKPAFRIVPELG